MTDSTTATIIAVPEWAESKEDGFGDDSAAEMLTRSDRLTIITIHLELAAQAAKGLTFDQVHGLIDIAHGRAI